jgi:membrane associated rhomboid family serine protease
MAVPDKKDRKRPAELLGLSGVLAAFMFLIVLMGTRDVVLALVFAGVGFIVALVGLAMLSLAAKPKDAEQADLDEQNRNENPRGH